MKALVSFNLLALLVAAMVVAGGQLDAVTKTLGPSNGDPVQALEQTPIGRSQQVNSKVQMNALLTEASLEAVSNGGSLPSRQELIKALRANEPGARVGTSVNRGGVAVYRKGQDIVVLCQRPNTSTVSCLAAHTTGTKAQVTAVSTSQSKAVKKALVALDKANPQAGPSAPLAAPSAAPGAGTATPNNGGSTDADPNFGSQGIIKKAQATAAASSK